MSFLVRVALISLTIFSVLTGHAVNRQRQNQLIGNIIKNALESYHYLHLKVGDDLSEKAFEQYLKRLDFGKQFLLAGDISNLSKYKKEVDDQLLSGKLKLLEESKILMVERIGQIDKYREKYFKKGINFNSKSTLELDSKKRKHLASISELKDLWSRIFTYETVISYLSLEEEQNGEKDKKDKKKKKKSKKKVKPVKKMSVKEMKEEAQRLTSKKYQQLFSRLIKDDYDDYIEKFMNSVSTVFDPHTTYLPPKKKEDFDIDISGSLEGIGAVLQEDGLYIKVVKIVPGGAAWRGKELEAEDKILAVGQGDGEPVDLVGMRVDDAVRYIRGKKDTEVRLTLKKADGSRKIISIIRDMVRIGESYAKSSILTHKKSGHKVGYIRLPKFYRDFGGKGGQRNCSDDVHKEIIRLKKEGIKGLILDLRSNGGGALEDARKMSGLFIKQGPIVQVKDHTGKLDILKDRDPDIEYKGPLIVLINRFSASASEIVAAAMQDYGRGVVVGGKFSHGKGTVQAVLDLNQGPLINMFGPKIGALKVTIQKFYRVNGGSTQYRGVTPDIILPDAFSGVENRENDLDYSLKWDETKKLRFSRWQQSKLNISKLIANSQKRAKRSKGLKRIQESLSYMAKRRKQTEVTVNLKRKRKEDKKNKKILEGFKQEKSNQQIQVSHFEKSLMEAEQIRQEDKKQWQEDLKERKKEWVEGIQKDPVLEESLFIIEDMLS
jgi:carboxyl-terminal processing protease